MSNSWKIGAVSGLIAGLFTGIISTLMTFIYFYSSLRTSVIIDPNAGNFANTPTFAIIVIIHTIIWGIILGIIYSKSHQVISEKVINKGLLFGLFCGLVFLIRDASFLVAYAYIDPSTAIRTVIHALIIYIPFGLILAALYQRWYKGEKQKIITYDMKSGIQPGAIAGFIGGVVAYICALVYPFIGLYPPLQPDWYTNINLQIGVFGTHVFIHLLWGAIFGAIFARVYNVVPKKGILKGLIYGLIITLISGVQITTYYVSMGLAFNNFLNVIWGIVFTMFEIFTTTTYGLVLGLLYRKPSE